MYPHPVAGNRRETDITDEVFYMKKEKGQALVEIALVIPLLFLLVFGIIYSGMLFHDYSQLNNVVRQAARERATALESVSNETIQDRYFDYENHKFKTAFMTNIYRPAQGNPFEITMDGTIVRATIQMELGPHSPIMASIVPASFRIVYHMRQDTNETTDENAGQP